MKEGAIVLASLSLMTDNGRAKSSPKRADSLGLYPCFIMAARVSRFALLWIGSLARTEMDVLSGIHSGESAR